MAKANKVLGVIPARMASKRLPQKNIRLFAGKPLIFWTIESALSSQQIDSIIVTSDSIEILELAASYGEVRTHLRSPKSSSDTATSYDYLSEVLLAYQGFDSIVLLQPTSPLRNQIDIDNAMELHYHKFLPVVSVSENLHSPFWSFEITPEGALQSLFPESLKMRSQELKQTYYLNGAIYVDLIENYCNRKTFISANTVPFFLDDESSVDIDTLEDFDHAERIMIRRLGNA